MCITCYARKDKKEFLRIVCNKEKNVTLDKTGKSQGRGAYICYSQDCVKKATKTKRLDRSFKTSISEEVYENMWGVVIDNEKM